MKTRTTRRGGLTLAASAAMCVGVASPAQAAPDACELLTDPEVAQLISRGQPSYSSPEAMALAGGKASICQYEHGQVGLWTGPDSERDVEQFMESWQQEEQPRHPVPGVGDKAYVIYPKPRNDYSDQGPYLVAAVGPHTVTAALFAREGLASGLMGEVCRGDQSRMNEKEKKECASVLADEGEKPESLQPAVVELARILVTKVRSGNFGQ